MPLVRRSERIHGQGIRIGELAVLGISHHADNVVDKRLCVTTRVSDQPFPDGITAEETA